MARPKKPVVLQKGKLTNEEKRIRKEQEDKLKVGHKDLAIAPSWLDVDAREEFDRVVRGMLEINVIDNLDLAVLAIYADAFSNYIKMTQEINANGAIEDYTNAAGATNRTMAAAVQVQIKYADMIMKCSSKLGLTVSDRLSLVVPEYDDSGDLLLQALKGGKK